MSRNDDEPGDWVKGCRWLVLATVLFWLVVGLLGYAIFKG